MIPISKPLIGEEEKQAVIDEETFNINPALIELHIIEDACQTIGATYHGKPAGSFGTRVFSHYAPKNIMAGEGGIITTDNEQIAEQCHLLRSHGIKQRYYHEIVGFNFRLSDLHAAIGLVQMSWLHELTQIRQHEAACLNANIKSVVTPKVKTGYDHVWHQYTVRVNHRRDRDLCVQKLIEKGIGTGIFYSVPAHRHEYMRDIVGEKALPVAERLATEVISLPIHPQLSGADLEAIVAEVNRL